MFEVLNTLAASVQSMTVPELIALLIALLTALVALVKATERLVKAVSGAIRALIEFVQLFLHREYESDEP